MCGRFQISTHELKLKGFKVYEIDSEANAGHNYSRKDFYKISLTTGKFIFHYADRSFETDETILFFGNPRIPYSCEVVSPIIKWLHLPIY